MVRESRALEQMLDAFVAQNPDGWDHGAWEGLLTELRALGHDTQDSDGLGVVLERRRLVATLEALPVKGLGPKRRDAVAERFQRLWELRQASIEDVASVPSLNRKLAEDLLRAIR